MNLSLVLVEFLGIGDEGEAEDSTINKEKRRRLNLGRRKSGK